MASENEFKEFLEPFVKELARKDKQLQKANWILETTSSQDASDLRADLETEVKLLFSNRETYDRLLQWQKENFKDPLLARQLNVLIRAFKQNMLPEELLQKMADAEAVLTQTYGNFRAELEGKELSENDIIKLLKEENDPKKRKKVWEASKAIGKVMAPQILKLVELRNEAAKNLGYSDYFSMMLELQEVDEGWLFETLEELVDQSDEAYTQVLEEIKEKQAKRFHVQVEELGPWAWSEPFCQGDPLDSQELDELIKEVDFIESAKDFYKKMGFDVTPTIEKSDNFERPSKSQHAFCINIDRGQDVRTLNNIRPTIRWLETLLHELGHAIYYLGCDPKLPWLLREPPHMITTEAMALIAGRQAYRKCFLKQFVSEGALLDKAETSLKRRQLIFSRFVLVMSTVERQLYRNPHQNMNKVWWDAVKKYQKLKVPSERESGTDWATKVHMGLAPVYYYSYLLGELFASSIEETLKEKTGSSELTNEKAGEYLNQKLFSPGNSFHWNQLVENVIETPLTPKHWLKQFAGK